MYITGNTFSATFPATPGALQTTYGRNGDAFVSKVNSSTGALLFSTYLGGSGPEVGLGIAVDNASNVYVTGNADGSGFPTTPGAFQQVAARGACFVSKISADGKSLMYSTFIWAPSGTSTGNAIVVDSTGAAYVAGQTEGADFPTLPGAYDTVSQARATLPDAFVLKLNPAGSALLFSTLLGGKSSDVANALALDSAGNIFIGGTTTSPDFPTTPGASQPFFSPPPGSEGFVAKLNPTASALLYSTFLGATYSNYASYVQGLAVDSSGDAIAVGYTYARDFPVTNNIPQSLLLVPSQGYAPDLFVAKLDPMGQHLIYSTHLGYPGGNQANGVALDVSGNVWMAGRQQLRAFRSPQEHYKLMPKA